MNNSVEHRLFTTRHLLVDRLLAGLALIAVVGVPTSLTRIHLTGWLPLYWVHIALGLVVIGSFLLRQRLSWQFKSALILSVLWVIGLGGLMTLGIVSYGTWWLVVSALVVAIVYSVKAAVLLLIPIIVAVGLAGWGFVTGGLSPPFDANAYLQDASAWYTLVIGFVFLPVLVFLAVASQNSTILGLLREVEYQRVEIERLAIHDELTGVPRAKLAMDRLEQALRHVEREGGQLALLFIDLDYFKAVNDTHGHEAGDLVLTQVAQRFQQSIDQQEGLKVAQTLIDVIRQPVVTVYGSCQADASIGVASIQGPGRAGEACGRCDTPSKAGGKNQAMLVETGPVAESAAQRVANG